MQFVAESHRTVQGQPEKPSLAATVLHSALFKEVVHNL